MNEQESVVHVDPINLDKECEKLPTQYLQWSTKQADARMDVSEKKAELEVIEADLNQYVREHYAKHGMDKPTEKGISAAVLQKKEYQQAQRALFKAQHAADIAGAVVSALEHKKRSLTLLVELHTHGWASSVKVSPEAREKLTQQTREKTRRKLAWTDEDEE